MFFLRAKNIYQIGSGSPTEGVHYKSYIFMPLLISPHGYLHASLLFLELPTNEEYGIRTVGSDRAIENNISSVDDSSRGMCISVQPIGALNPARLAIFRERYEQVIKNALLVCDSAAKRSNAVLAFHPISRADDVGCVLTDAAR